MWRVPAGLLLMATATAFFFLALYWPDWLLPNVPDKWLLRLGLVLTWKVLTLIGLRLDRKDAERQANGEYQRGFEVKPGSPAVQSPP